MIELENDDVIYNRLVEVDQELLVSNMLDTAMTNPNLTLIDFLILNFIHRDIERIKRLYFVILFLQV
jgi:hypothetical protein